MTFLLEIRLDDSTFITEHSLVDWDVIHLKRVVMLDSKSAEKKLKSFGLSSHDARTFGNMSEADYGFSKGDENSTFSFNFQNMLGILCVRDDAVDLGSSAIPAVTMRE